jgi:hypothetical protein
VDRALLSSPDVLGVGQTYPGPWWVRRVWEWPVGFI